MTKSARRRQAEISAHESRIANERAESPRGSRRLEIIAGANKLHVIRELGKFDVGQFAAVNR